MPYLSDCLLQVEGMSFHSNSDLHSHCQQEPPEWMCRRFGHCHRMRISSQIHFDSKNWQKEREANFHSLASYVNFATAYWIKDIAPVWWLVFWVVCVLSIHSVVRGISLTCKHIINAISSHHLVCWHTNSHPSWTWCFQLKENSVTVYQWPLHVSTTAVSVTAFWESQISLHTCKKQTLPIHAYSVLSLHRHTVILRCSAFY